MEARKTRAQLISGMKRRLKKASPAMRELLLDDMKRRSKAQLEDYNKRLKVTRGGSVKLT
ncbi:MAG: hypothetical protein FJ013_01680 [Chloroflexi bacterium]|nr:hypothetical protein [Chloroflexota bacterium]MBM4453275.1 hypothetical protein [Chloroflexota bacterium]